MDISITTDEKELKALWYDELTKKEQAQINMEQINQRIIQLRQQPQAEQSESEG